MAQSTWYRILSILMLLVIVFPVFPGIASARVVPRAAAEVESAVVAPGTAVPPDFTVPRPAEGETIASPGHAAATGAPWSFLPLTSGEPERIVTSPGYAPVYSPPSAPLSYQPVEDYVFVTLDMSGVVRWDGITWTQVNEGLSSANALQVRQIAVDPFNPTTLLIATGDGVYRTTDALGRCSWERCLITPAYSIEAAPGISGTFYAGTGEDDGEDGAFFFRSTDGGETWSRRDLGSGVWPQYDQASDICLGPAGNDMIYIPNWNVQVHIFWRSTDGGSDFDRMAGTGLPGSPRACAVDPVSGTVYMTTPHNHLEELRIAKSTDGGGSWETIEPEQMAYGDIAVSPFDRRVWAIGSGCDKVFSSSNQGDSWQMHNLGQCQSLRVVDFGAPPGIWISTYGVDSDNPPQLWFSSDGGATWLSQPLPDTNGVYSASDLAPLSRYYYALVSPTLSLVVVTPTTVTADGLDPAAITVTVLGEHGLPIPGVTVVLTHTGVATLTQPVSPTDALGRAFGSIRSSQAGVVHVSAYASGVDLGEAAPVTFVGTDLAVAKAGPAVAAPGETLTYTLALANAGRLAASSVVVTDTLPAGVTFVTHTAPFTFSRNGPVLTWDVGALANGAATSWTVTVTLALTAPQGAELENTATAGSPAAEHNRANNQAAVTTRVLDALTAAPDNPFLAVAAGGRADLAITVRNTGPNTVYSLTVTLPPAAPGLSAPPNLGDLGPGTDTVFTLTATPPTTTLSGYYQGVVLVQSAGGAQAGVGLTLYVAGGPTGTVVFSVTDELAAAVAGAELTLISTTGGLSFHGQAGPEGTYTFDSIPQGSYLYQVGAPGYAVFWGSAEVTGTPGQINVVLASDYVDYEWWAEETTLTDTYNIYLTITYQLGNRPLLVPCGPWLEAPLQGGTYRGEFCLYNPSGVSLTNVHLERGTLDADIGVSFENGGDLGSVAASRTVAITFTSGVGFPDNYAAGDLLVLGVYSENHPFRSVLHVLVNPAPITCTCTLVGNLFRTHCYWPRQPGGGGGGGGGGGAPPPPYIPPPPNPPPPEQVRLRLSQSATLARQAFVANLAMANYSPKDLTAVSITLTIRDAQGQDARAFFAVDDARARWNSLEAGEYRTWRWMLVPLACAGGTEPRGLDYYISATVAFSVNGSLVGFQTVPERLTVRPQPRLFLYYYLPAAIEAGVPFRVQVVAQDWGYGPARDLRMSVPALQTSGAEGVAFQVVGSDLEFGDIAPFQLALGYVDLQANVDATVENVGAQLRQRDLRGLRLNPLILSARVYLVYSESVQFETESTLPDPGPECAPGEPPPEPHMVRVVGTAITVTAFPGELVTHTYTVYNLNLSDPISISLEADSENGWTVEVSGTGQPEGGGGIQGAEGTILVAPGQGVPVQVRLLVPEGTAYGTMDLGTLLGAYYFNPLLSDSDDTTTQVAPVKILRIEVLPTTDPQLNSAGWYTPNPLTYRVSVSSREEITIDGFEFLLAGSGRLEAVPTEQPEGRPRTGDFWSCTEYQKTCSETFTWWPLATGENLITWTIWVPPMEETWLGGIVDFYWEGQYFVAAAPTVRVPTSRIHPVIIVPGILGTWPPSPNGRLDPWEHVYDPLRDYLEKIGYEPGVSFFEFPYDWRESVVVTGPLLGDKIAEIKGMQGPSYVDYGEVDIVAHSMGGLVARAYLEGADHSEDVSKLITLATPHRGSPEDYLTWEGVELRGWEGWGWTMFLFIVDQWAGGEGYCDYCTHWIIPYVWCAAWSCRPGERHDYLHGEVWGVRDLLPVTDLPEGKEYLVQQGTGVPYPFGRPWNYVLDGLNNGVTGVYTPSLLLDDGLEVWALYSLNFGGRTILQIQVQDCFTGTCQEPGGSFGPTDPLWEYGKPYGELDIDRYVMGQNSPDLSNSGDSVVPGYSAAITTVLGLEELNGWRVETGQGGWHMDIPRECRYLAKTGTILTGAIFPPDIRIWINCIWYP